MNMSKSKWLLAGGSLVLLLFAAVYSACVNNPVTLDTVLKDLPAESYALNFEGLDKDPVLTKAQWGAANTEILMDIEEICPPLRKFGYKKFPRNIIWPPVNRNIVLPPQIVQTCPDFIPFKVSDALLNVLKTSKWQYAKEIQTVRAGDYALVGTAEVFKTFASIQPDSMDMAGMRNVQYDKVFLLPQPDGFFRRPWYGDAGLAAAGLTYGRFRDLFPQKQIGCFDPEQLRLIRENLVKINPAQFEGLKVQEIAGVKGAALSF
jgi:hypothetical protein